MGEAASRALRVALIADRETQGQNLKALLETNGLTVIVDQTIRDYDPEAVGPDEVDVLLVNLDDDTSHEMDRLEALIEHSAVPILFNEGGVPGGSGWGRKLIAKLAGLVQRRESAPAEAAPVAGLEAQQEAPSAMPAEASAPPPAPRPALRVVGPDSDGGEPLQRVWVLGASLGGPQALKLFLSHLPADLPVGIVIAQHIGKPFVPLLAEQLDRVSPLRIRPAETDRALRAGEAVLVPVDRRFRLTDAGVVQLTDEPIRGPYKPCIDEVMEEVLSHYGSRTGAIVFSGMGEDGALGAKAVSAAGGPVWAQEAESCVISSMPDATRRRDCVEFTGTPEELAARLAALCTAQAAAD
ncbi:MAG: chemotaxis protein CheB [Gammaproteobacteria bacterium]